MLVVVQELFFNTDIMVRCDVVAYSTGRLYYAADI